MSFFTYVDFPAVPEELFEYAYDAIQNQPLLLDRKRMIETANAVTDKSIDHLLDTERAYHRFIVAKPLSDYIYTFLEPDYEVYMQTIKGGMRTAIHIDLDRHYVYNYIIDTGGPRVFTNWYNSQRKIIESVEIEPFRWHQIDVSQLHNVSGATPGRTRLAITAFRPSK